MYLQKTPPPWSAESNFTMKKQNEKMKKYFIFRAVNAQFIAVAAKLAIDFGHKQLHLLFKPL